MAIPGAVTTKAGCVRVRTLACAHTFKERGREEGSGGRRTEERGRRRSGDRSGRNDANQKLLFVGK